MSYYLILFIFVLSIITVRFSKRFENNYYLYYILISILIIVAGFKTESTSHDTFNYVEHYVKHASLSNFASLEVFRYEPGYLFIEALCGEITSNPTFLFLIIALFSIYSYHYAIKKKSPLVYLSIFVYISFFYFKREIITIRYGLSCALFLLSIIAFSENENKKGYFFSLLSFMFHYTALSVIPLLFLIKNKESKTVVGKTEMFVFIAGLFSIIGVDCLSSLLYLQDICPPFISNAIAKGTNHLGEEDPAGLKQIVPYLPFIVFYHYTRTRTDLLRICHLSLLTAIFYMIELNQAASFSRIGQFFTTVLVIYIPLLYTELNTKCKAIFRLYTMTICLYTFIRISFFNSGGFINVHW